MVAHALELTRLAVELESVLRRIADRADTEAGVDFVDDLLVFIYASARRIEVRRLGRPELRIHHLRYGLLSLGCRNHFALEEDISLHAVVCMLYSKTVHAVLQFYLDGHLRKLFAHLGCTHEHAEGGDVDRVGLDEVHVAVEACARIPAALLGFVLQEDIDVDAVAGDELRQDVAVEGVVAVRPIDHFLAVHIDVGMAHRAVEDESVELLLIYFHARAVVAFAHPRKASATTGFPGRLFLAVLYDDDFLQVVGSVERPA